MRDMHQHQQQQSGEVDNMAFVTIIIVAVVILVSSLKVIKEYERGVRFTLGRFTGVMGPGMRLILPIIQSYRRVDIRTKVIDVPKQDAMTKDNVSVEIDAVIYYRISDAGKAVIDVKNYFYAVSQLAQTTMRDVVGQITLDELLGKRDEISKRIMLIVDKASDPWGIKVESVELKDILLPESLIRSMGKEAEAEREKRAVIIKAEGEFEASTNIAKAAYSLNRIKGGLHIRTLHTINNLGAEKSITKIYAVPSEILKELIK